MDDETAEIELLEQNLHKTRQISQRMVSILSNFDQRLGKLEKSIMPLYNSTQLLTRRQNNIESALLKIDEVAGNQEGIAAEEALILRGPQPQALGVYKEALERLNASIAFKSSDVDSRDTARLVESGARKLVQLYTKMVAEGSSGSPSSSDGLPDPFPSHLLTDLRPLVDFLRTLPSPATHPTHPAAPAILAVLRDAQRGYADMRGGWLRRAVEPLSRRVVESADTVDGVEAGRQFTAWVDGLILVAEDEYTLLLELAPLPAPSPLTETYGALLAPLSALFGSTVTTLSALIKRALHRYAFLALSAHACLASRQADWDELHASRAGRRGGEGAMRDAVAALRAMVLRSFPEFLADIKMAALGPKSGDLGTGLADVTMTTVQYLDRVPEVADVMSTALLTLGDGNWRMGEGTQVAKGPKLGEGDERAILEHYLHDVVSTTLMSLTALARTARRPTHGSAFLLNNVAHLRTRLLDAPRSDIASVLPPATREALQSNFRTAKAGYFDSNFSPLMQALADDRERGQNKAATKEKFTRFYDLLEEVAERHRVIRVLEDDEIGRETIAEEVVKLVVPSLQRFMQKTREKEFSKNPQKYIKMSAESVEAQLRSFYT